jgi:CDP-diacylglycerol---serine O-phosphatidyltransferase
MITLLRDPANAITTSGIALSGYGLTMVLTDRLEFAIALGLWAMLADQLDGIVAKRTANRSAMTAAVGKSLDGFGDLVYGAILPAMILITATDGWFLSTPIGIALIAAGALRLSNFSIHGLESGYFKGVPLSYDMPIIAAIFLLRPSLSAGAFALAMTAACAILTTLHVLPIKILAPGRRGYFFIVIIASGLSMAVIASGM